MYDHCKNHPEWVDPKMLQALAQEASDNKLIDNVSNMRTHPVYCTCVVLQIPAYFK